MTNFKHGRFPLFQSPSKPGGSATTIPGSTDLGTYNTGGYSRITGLLSTVGSMTLRWQMGVYSGNYQVPQQHRCQQRSDCLRPDKLRSLHELHRHGGERPGAEIRYPA
jgi:hypothetical protein